MVDWKLGIPPALVTNIELVAVAKPVNDVAEDAYISWFAANVALRALPIVIF
jgi:hypothetical protein